MRKLFLAAFFAAAAFLPREAIAQPAPTQSACPYIAYGAVLTSAQWNYCFQIKQDNLGYTPLNVGGGTMAGPLVTAPSTTGGAGFSIAPGSPPSAPINGNMWVTSLGMFVQINGANVGPLISAATLPYGANISAGIVQCDGTTITCGANGLITAVGAAATSIAVGVTTISSGTTKGLFYDNGGVLGNLATGNNGVLITSGSGVPSISTTLPSGIAATNMSLSTPTLGVASGTSLALGGATIGGNALAVTGTVLLNTPLSLASGGTAADLTASNGGIVYSTASALAILAGTSTAGECLLSGSNTTPSWGACAGAAAVASVGNASADTTLTIAGTGSGPYTGAVTVKLNLGNSNSWSAAQSIAGLTVTSSFTATGLVTAADLASVTGSGSTVVLASSPSISSLTVTSGFTATGLVTTGDLQATTGSGDVVLSSSATLVSPTISGTLTASTTIINGTLTLNDVISSTGTAYLCFNDVSGLITQDSITCITSARETKTPRGAPISGGRALEAVLAMPDGVPVWTRNNDRSQVIHAGLYADDAMTLDHCGVFENGKIRTYDDRCVLGFVAAAFKEYVRTHP